MKIGIVYYSRTGNTRHVAKLLEEKLKEKKADVELVEIEHIKKPGFFKAGRAAMAQNELPIKNTEFNLKKYDMILVGTPTWAGRPSPYLKTFLNKAENIKGKKGAIFSIGGTPIDNREKVVEIIKNDLKNIGIKATDDYLALRMKNEQIVEGEQDIDNFVKTVIKK